MNAQLHKYRNTVTFKRENLVITSERMNSVSLLSVLSLKDLVLLAKWLISRRVHLAVGFLQELGALLFFLKWKLVQLMVIPFSPPSRSLILAINFLLENALCKKKRSLHKNTTRWVGLKLRTENWSESGNGSRISLFYVDLADVALKMADQINLWVLLTLTMWETLCCRLLKATHVPRYSALFCAPEAGK